MSGIAERSPFPGSRNRRRISAGENSSIDESFNFTSPFLMASLSQSRISPSAGYFHSPSNANLSRRSRRFFDDSEPRRRSRDSEGGVLGTAIPAASGPLSHPDLNGTSDKVRTAALDDVVVDEMNLSQIRRIAKSSLQSSTEMAVFYASILYSKSQLLDDAFFYAQALMENKEKKRAVMVLDRSGLLGTEGTILQRIEAALLAGQALCQSNEWQEASQLLEDFCVSGEATKWSKSCILDDDDEAGWQAFYQSISPEPDSIHPVARLCYWRGRCYDETSHPPRASIYWKRALQIDPKCVQAFNALFNRNLITAQEVHELVSNLKMDADLHWLRRMYLARIHMNPTDVLLENIDQEPSILYLNGDANAIHMTSPPIDIDTMSDHIFEEDTKMSPKSSLQKQPSTALEDLWKINKLHNSPEVLSLAAIRAYQSYDLQGAFEYCQELTAIDPLCQTASFVHVATLLGLNHKRILFGLGHEWVEASPQSARSWFAVGCYYYACGRFHVAQQHFCRATRLDPLCSEAWIAFGCAFAACDESDQALAAFRAAQRLAPAEHAAMLYMGMEYVRTNHLVLAQHSLTSALTTSGGDPLCFHELGVAAFQRKDWVCAIDWYSKGLQAIARTIIGEESTLSTLENAELVQSDFWEPTLFNLGHCYRKTRQFEAAIVCFEKCLVLTPGSASALSAFGFTKHLMGDFDGAIEIYHQALSRQPDDPFSSEMLNRALQEAISVSLVIQSPRPERDSRNLRRSLDTTDQSRRSSQRGHHDTMMESDEDPDLSLESYDVDMGLS